MIIIQKHLQVYEQYYSDEPIYELENIVNSKSFISKLKKAGKSPAVDNSADVKT